MKRIIVIALIAAATQGCSTIMNGASQDVRIASEPAGAAYTIVGNGVTRTGMTPAVERLSAGSGYFSKAEYTVTYSKDGYADAQKSVQPKVAGWYWVGLCVGSMVSWLITDPLTGGMWKMPEEVNVAMKEEK